MKERRAPERGNVVWINFDSSRGHEQHGRRPAIVISPVAYNQKTGLALACPVTSKTRHYTHEVSFVGEKISGVILVDQVRNIDWLARKAEFVESVHPSIMDEVEAKLLTLIS